MIHEYNFDIFLYKNEAYETLNGLHNHMMISVTLTRGKNLLNFEI